MRIGPYQLENNLIVAPMAGVTDRPFRQRCRELGAGLAVSEMVSAQSALQTHHKTLRRLNHEGEKGPITVQILGAEPSSMAAAAALNVDRGAQIIDINMGCPAKKVCKANAGSALLQDTALIEQILRAVVTAVEVPVTLKIRTGWSPETRNGLQVAKIAEDCGIQALTIHGRTRACGFSGEAEYETIRTIKQAIAIPVIANGDINSPQKAAAVLQATGADGLMIGRAAQGRPWIFREINHFLTCGELLPAPSRQWVMQLLLKHIDELYQFYGEYQGIRVARKHIAWYSKGLTEGATFRQRIYRADSIDQQREMIQHFFNQPPQNEGLAA
ncbi:MAG: tRNA dihydrouridine synthase DusB [Candidatus Polarisedimenticolaceae bacterium]|nr:tRNA dihydrouridine synthase DusB [Candidatus Polarisedimenticolaceae bacterium]